MRRRRLIVKLGGSVLTNKADSGPPRFRAAAARNLARQLVTIQRDQDVFVVLGAGSWGHPQALRHGVGTRVLSGAAKKAALAEIGASVGQLRQRFCVEAAKAGLAVVPISGPALVRPGSRFSLHVEPLRWMLQGRLVPVTGGDVIADARRGLRILSGDEIAQRLVRPLMATQVVFATDVPGILVDGNVVPRLGKQQARRLVRSMGAGPDATGGMRGKLEQAIEILRQGVDVRIVDGRRATALLEAARGEPAGTWLRP